MSDNTPQSDERPHWLELERIMPLNEAEQLTPLSSRYAAASVSKPNRQSFPTAHRHAPPRHLGD